MTDQDIVNAFGFETTAYQTAHGTMVFLDDWMSGYTLDDRTNRGNAPWKNSEHIVLSNVETSDFISTVWEPLVKKDWERPSVQKLYKLNADGTYSLYGSNAPSANGPIETGPLVKLLLHGVLGREVKVSVYARSGFRLINRMGLWKTGDLSDLTSTASGGTKGFKTKGIPVLKEKKGVPGEVKEYGSTRYYSDCIVHLEGKEFYLTSMFYNASFDKLAEFFSSHGLTMTDILKEIKTELGDVMHAGDLGRIQKVVYGAPGTGKSFGTEKILANKTEAAKAICYRTTFHPDSDYSTFVGAYKPTMAGDKIRYAFRPQAFMNAYVKSWRELAGKEDNPKKSVALIIEEINRGNCAQIFGDLFQLLDRDDETGYSSYPITTDRDLADWLKGAEQFGAAGLTGIAKPGCIEQCDWDAILMGDKLALPPTLYIWATMNTSDQSLFPIDSAFKRRWDWEYVPITNHPDKDYKIEIGSDLYDWWDFLTAINDRIWSATDSEDKKLGYFFVKAQGMAGKNLITADRFVNKVIFYLWNDVFKNSDPEKAFKFMKPDGKDALVTFQEFFNKEDGRIDEDMVKRFIEGLGMKPVAAKSALPDSTVAGQGGGQPAASAPTSPAANS